MSIHWTIIRKLLSSPLRRALVDDRGERKAAELLVGAAHVAGAVQPVCKTGTLGLLLPTSGAFPVAALAGWMLGKTIVPINYLLKKAEMEHVVRDCGCDTVVTVGPMLDFLGEEGRRLFEGPGAIVRGVRMDEIDYKGFPEPVWPASNEDSDLAVLLYTSGTSGKPKGVMLTHGNLTANVEQVKQHVDFTTKDVMLGVLPQFHSFGLTVLTLLPLCHEIKVVYTARFVPAKIVRLIREHRPTIFVAIPSMYNALLSVKDAGPEDFASLKYVVSGGEPLPEAVFNRFRERFGVTINEGFGMTETAPVTNWCRPYEWRRRSVGPALPGVEQRIADPGSGRTLGRNEDGELQMRGPNVTCGYYHLPQETAALFTPDGFLKSGDMARIDDDGHLYITGRIKEMIIVGGENVFPREIEEVLNRHPDVKDSGVIGVSDPLRGETPMAFVEPHEGLAPDPAVLVRWCREHLAGYKVPSEVRVVEALPRNATGKIVRRELKKMV